MRSRHILISVLTILLAVGTVSAKELKPGKKVPTFSLTDSHGKIHHLTDYKGKYVVLEWVNYDCPFVKKHYNSGNMQKLQKAYTEKDVVWLSICSSAEGKQGHFEPDEINRRAVDHDASFSAYLIDADGKVGRWYGARTTPHMYIIDPEGKLVYAGGIDDIKSTNVADIPEANNYVAAALDAVLAGERIATPTSKPYGCSVKYK